MFNWRTYTKDPNDPSVGQKYREFLLSICEYHVLHRDDFILSECRNKSILDIGPCEHTEKYMSHPDWFFAKLKKVASKVVGVDINQELVTIANEKGHDIRYIDATSENSLDEKFDVIHAGDVIEHVSNIGSLLSFIKRHLKDDGKVIISTPNPFNRRYFFQTFKYATMIPNFEHTCWITPTCMNELAKRESLELSRICFPVKPSSGRKIMVKVKPLRRFMEVFSGEYIFILKKPKN